jgi:hypothetical protein
MQAVVAGPDQPEGRLAMLARQSPELVEDEGGSIPILSKQILHCKFVLRLIGEWDEGSEAR